MLSCMSLRRATGILLCSCLLCAIAVCNAEAKVLFYSGFEGKADAGLAAGDGKARIEGAAKFADGKRGQALLCGDGNGALIYNANGNLLPQQGTVEMWAQAVDWTSADKHHHVFMDATNPGWFVLYKYKDQPVLYFLLSEDHKEWQVLDDGTDFGPGKWVYMAVTWSKEKACLYVNGIKVRELASPPLPKGLSQFTVGDLPWGEQRAAHSLIDELYIHDRALSNKEIAWAFAHVADREQGKDIPDMFAPMSVRVSPYTAQKQLAVDVTTGRRGGGISGAVELEPSVGTKAVPLQVGGDGEACAVIQYEKLPAGDYKVKVTLKDSQGSELGKQEFPFKVPETPWRGNKIGITDTPPPPFTPLALQQGKAGNVSIKCWGREYHLGELGLPVEMVTQDAQILSSPIRLSAEAKGANETTWKSEPPVVKESNAVTAVISGSATSDLGTLRWVCTAEYDGLLRYDLRLEPGKDIALDQLELAFPLKSEYARLNWRHCAMGHELRPGAFYHGAMPSKQGVFFDNPWTPYVWLGDEERGLAVFCESTCAWQKVDGSAGFRMERDKDGVRVVWSFANGEKPWKLAKPWEFTFGIEATPVKDTSQWRKWRLYSLVQPPPGGFNVWLLLPGRHGMVGNLKYFGYPEAADMAERAATVKAWQDDSTRHSGTGPSRILQYVLTLVLSNASPEAFFIPEWRRDPPPGGEWGTGDYYLKEKETMVSVVPTPDWTDWMVWKCDRLVRETGLDGLYVDFAMIQDGSNIHTGFKYDVRDGAVQSSYWPFFATRELNKRLYTMLKSCKPDSFIMGHMSYQMFIPYLAFYDGILNGEHLGGPAYDEFGSLPALMPQGVIQSEYMGHNYGVASYQLPMGQRKKWDNWDGVSEPYMISMSLLHDYGLMHGAHVMDGIYKAFNDFDIVPAEFIPYWRNADMVSGQSDKVKCSVYRNAGKGALMAVGNCSGEVQQTALVVDWTKLLGAPPVAVLDALTGEPVKTAQNSLTVDLPPYGYRLVRANLK